MATDLKSDALSLGQLGKVAGWKNRFAYPSSMTNLTHDNRRREIGLKTGKKDLARTRLIRAAP
jgi:hypothetical protein